MKTKDALTTLVRYQQWRRGIIDTPMRELFTPQEVTEALDVAIEVMRVASDERPIVVRDEAWWDELLKAMGEGR